MKILIDPCAKYPNARPEQIIESLGYLLPWLLDGLAKGEDAQTALVSRYMFYTGPFDLRVPIEEDGTYTFPGDPPSYPVARFNAPNGETVFFYQHAFVAVISADGSVWMTRMD